MELVFFFSAFLYCGIVLLLSYNFALPGWLAGLVYGIHSKRMVFSFHFIRFHFISSCYTYSSGFVLFVEYYSEF